MHKFKQDNLASYSPIFSQLLAILVQQRTTFLLLLSFHLPGNLWVVSPLYQQGIYSEFIFIYPLNIAFVPFTSLHKITLYLSAVFTVFYVFFFF